MKDKEMVVREKLSNFMGDAEEFADSIEKLLDGKNIKPSEISKINTKVQYRLRILNEAIKLYCR
jgi:predicted transcriptional regulator